MGKGSSRFFYLDGPSSQWEVGTLISQSSHIPKQPIPTGSQSTTFSPDLCVGFLFLVLYPVRSSVLPSSVRSSRPPPIFHTQLCHTHTHTPSFTHNFVTPSSTHNFCHTIFHTQLLSHHLPHTTLSHTIFHTTLSHAVFPTQLCHTPSFTHNFVTHTHTIFHAQLCHAPIFHTELCHTPSFTHNFVTHRVSHTKLSHTHRLSHTNLSHTIFAALCVAGVALGDIDLRLWQVWRLWHWAGVVLGDMITHHLSSTLVHTTL